MNLTSLEAGAAGLLSSGTIDLPRHSHYAFEGDDCQSVAGRLRAMNVTTAVDPRNRPGRVLQMYLRSYQHPMDIFSQPKP